MIDNRISIPDLLALIEIINEYEQFEEDLLDLLGDTHNVDTLSKIRRLSHKERGIYPKAVKEFCKKYKDVLGRINQYTNIQSFVYHLTDINTDTNICKYLIKNVDSIETIKEVVLRLRKIGISEIEFNENLDFTKNTYHFWKWLADNSTIKFVDNITVIPEYPYGKITYVTTDSPFELTYDCFGNTISTVYNKAKFNSLVFDPNRLPENTSKEEITNPILEAKDKVEPDYTAIKNIIDLRLIEKELLSKLNKLEKVLEDSKLLANKENLKVSLEEIRTQIINIQRTIKAYEDEIIARNGYVTEEVLDKEEKAYERRKRDSECHIW